MTLQLIRDSTNSRGFLSERSVTGFLSDVYGPAADEVGKIFLIADERVSNIEMIITSAVSINMCCWIYLLLPFGYLVIFVAC